MTSRADPCCDLSDATALGKRAAEHWNLELEESFDLANVSFVAASGEFVVKVAWGGDDEALHEADALRLWNGSGAVHLLGHYETALLEERARPGTDLSVLGEGESVAVAVELAHRLWIPAREPFRPVGPAVLGWLNGAEAAGSDLAKTAMKIFEELAPSSDWVVHGDFHHHNILRHGEGYVAIDPKPYLSDREYDVVSFLWNPMDNPFDDLAQVTQRINAFVESGLDEYAIRAWCVVRGAYLRPDFSAMLRLLI